MKLKLLKSKKIIFLGTIGVLGVAITAPIAILNWNKDTTQDKIMKIASKITNKNILIAPNVSTENQSKIQDAIKNQLQKENSSLSDSDLSKISTDFSSLNLGLKNEVMININVNSKFLPLKIYVEKVNLLKNLNFNQSQSGRLFSDKFKNLWAMGKDIGLKVLRANNAKDCYVSTGWSSDTTKGLLKDLKVDNGLSTTIFQDHFGNLWLMTNNSKLQVLKVNQSGDGYENAWIIDSDKQTNDDLLKNSNINNSLLSKRGTFFQDSFKNLWAIGYGSKLQVLKVNSSGNGYVNTGWIDDNSGSGDALLKNSNIENNWTTTIFQDQFKNLWTISKAKKLQVLKVNSSGNGYVNSGWIDDNSGSGDALLKNSNVIDGENGTIFQDEFKNLWAMGKETGLQVLRANTSKNGYDESTGWTNATDSGLLKGSNITNGENGTIFQDEFKNLWAMGKETGLQVLRANTSKNGYDESTGWTNATDSGLLKGSNITNGENGTIFQDKFNNLWALAKDSKLQVLKVNTSNDGYVNSWIYNDGRNDENLLKGSKIFKGKQGKIFQDNFDNLWAMGFISKLQVLKLNTAKDDYVDSWQN